MEELAKSEEAIRQRLIEKRYCKEQSKEKGPFNKEQMQSLISDVQVNSNSILSKRQRIVYESDGVDDKNKEILTRPAKQKRYSKFESSSESSFDGEDSEKNGEENHLESESAGYYLNI